MHSDLKDEDYINNHYVIMATKKYRLKTSLEQYSRPRSNGINAITIKEDDELLEAKLTTGNSQVLLAVKSENADLRKVRHVPWEEMQVSVVSS